MGLSGDNCAPSPATTSTFPVVVVMLKNEFIVVALLVVMLVGGDTIVDSGNRENRDKGTVVVGNDAAVGVGGVQHILFEH